MKLLKIIQDLFHYFVRSRILIFYCDCFEKNEILNYYFRIIFKTKNKTDLCSAWAFAIFCTLLSFMVTSNDGVTVTKGSLLYAGLSMAIGPFFVFAPIKQMELKKKSILKTMATVAKKKETRYVTFALFILLTLIQILVAYGKNIFILFFENNFFCFVFNTDLYEIMTLIGLSSEQVFLTVFGYCLVALFYLVVFYTTLLGKVFKYNVNLFLCFCFKIMINLFDFFSQYN